MEISEIEEDSEISGECGYCHSLSENIHRVHFIGLDRTFKTCEAFDCTIEHGQEIFDIKETCYIKIEHENPLRSYWKLKEEWIPSK